MILKVAYLTLPLTIPIFKIVSVLKATFLFKDLETNQKAEHKTLFNSFINLN